jgi:CBS domain-containing protein
MAQMDELFKSLSLQKLQPGTHFASPIYQNSNFVTSTSYALEVMTDLHFVPPGVIGANVDCEFANHTMISRSVRLLLVVDDAKCVVGIITARDLLGERMEQALADADLSGQGVTVRQVMTVADDIEVLQMEEVLHSRVGDIIETLKNSGRQHALVEAVDTATGQKRIRGIFSATQIARQLGIPPTAGELGQTFAAIDLATTKHK